MNYQIQIIEYGLAIGIACYFIAICVSMAQRLFAKREYTYLVLFNDGSKIQVKGCDITGYGDSPEAAEIFISGRDENNDCAYFKTADVKSIVAIESTEKGG